MKQEFSKNKELQESLRKFREDAKKLEDSQDLKDARRKFESIEGENGMLRHSLANLEGEDVFLFLYRALLS